MAGILSTAFALLSSACLWGAFLFMLVSVFGKKKNERSKRIATVLFFAFLVFFVAFGVVRNFDMPHWNS